MCSLAESISCNRFLDSFKVKKFGLRFRIHHMKSNIVCLLSTFHVGCLLPCKGFFLHFYTGFWLHPCKNSIHPCILPPPLAHLERILPTPLQRILPMTLHIILFIHSCILPTPLQKILSLHPCILYLIILRPCRGFSLKLCISPTPLQRVLTTPCSSLLTPLKRISLHGLT